MRLVHKEQIFPRLPPVRKIPFQAHIQVKHVVVMQMIPSVQLEISRQYSNGAYLIFFGIFRIFLPRHLLFQMQDVKDSLVHPVKMSLRIRACIRIALAVFQRAELFLRRDRHRSKDQSLSPKDPECFLSDRPRYRLCGQIKQLIAFSLPIAWTAGNTVEASFRSRSVPG